eukprot:COSAG05_NODE_1585_length_4485_cov_2.704514_1_plen_97_part_00
MEAVREICASDISGGGSISSIHVAVVTTTATTTAAAAVAVAYMRLWWRQRRLQQQTTMAAAAELDGTAVQWHTDNGAKHTEHIHATACIDTYMNCT